MTVGTGLKETIASLKGIHATLQQMSAHTQGSEADQLLTVNAERVLSVAAALQERARFLEFEEPQYKG